MWTTGSATLYIRRATTEEARQFNGSGSSYGRSLKTTSLSCSSTPPDHPVPLSMASGTSIVSNLMTNVDTHRLLESNRGEFAKFCVESQEYITGQSMVTAHTCFNRLVLPNYPTEDLLCQQLKLVLASDFNGVFGLD